jgi:uncharacterized protein
MSTAPTRIAPFVDDDNREFWTSGESGSLRLPFCVACDHWIFPPVRLCATCGSEAEHRPVSGRGRVFTYTVNHHAFNPEVTVPYVIAIVELIEQDGLRFTTNIVNCQPEAVTVGLPVQVLFEAQGEFLVPVFEPAPKA